MTGDGSSSQCCSGLALIQCKQGKQGKQGNHHSLTFGSFITVARYTPRLTVGNYALAPVSIIIIDIVHHHHYYYHRHHHHISLAA
jgi:hypothetical protein